MEKILFSTYYPIIILKHLLLTCYPLHLQGMLRCRWNTLTKCTFSQYRILQKYFEVFGLRIFFSSYFRFLNISADTKTSVFDVSFHLSKVTWPCCYYALASLTLQMLNVKQNWWGVFLLIATCGKIIIFSVLDNMLWHLGLAKHDLRDLFCCQFWSEWCAKTKAGWD